MAICVFGVRLTHKTVQKGKIQPKGAIQKPFTIHKNTRKDHADEE
jgi:hypothetical protein